MKWDIETKTNILLGLFVSALIAANLLGTKITNVFIDFSVGLFAFPITFLITDIIEEVHGKQKSRQFLMAGVVSLIFVLTYTSIAVSLPFAERSFVQEDYTKVFGASMRIMLASVVAFAISQSHDIWAFAYWRKKTKGKYLWLRNNLSTIVSQFLDSTIFMFIAFYAVGDKFTAAYIMTLVIPYWLLKVVVALFDTPICYLGVWWLRGEKK